MRGRPGPTETARRGALWLILGVVLSGFSLAGCGSGSSSNTLIIYNGQHVQTTDALVAGFQKLTGISVSVRSAGEDVLADTLVNEGSRSPADVVLSENSPALQFLAARHLLLPVRASTLARTPSPDNSPRCLWVGVSARVSVLIYNPSRISAAQLPRSVLNLADHRFAGKIAFSAQESDIQPLVASVLHAVGRAATLHWLEGIKANAGSNILPNSESIVNEVNSGQVAFGVIDQYYWYRLQAQLGAGAMHSRLAYFAPRDPGYVVAIAGAGVVRFSHHQRAAQRFLAYVVSRAGQEIIARSSSFEYPIASGVVTAKPETPFSQLQPRPVSITELGDGSSALALLRAVGLL